MCAGVFVVIGSVPKNVQIADIHISITVQVGQCVIRSVDRFVVVCRIPDRVQIGDIDIAIAGWRG